MFSDQYSPKTTEWTSSTRGDYIDQVVKQEIKEVEERLWGEIWECFDQVERKIDLFFQLVGKGRF